MRRTPAADGGKVKIMKTKLSEVASTFAFCFHSCVTAAHFQSVSIFDANHLTTFIHRLVWPIAMLAVCIVSKTSSEPMHRAVPLVELARRQIDLSLRSDAGLETALHWVNRRTSSFVRFVKRDSSTAGRAPLLMHLTGKSWTGRYSRSVTFWLRCIWWLQAVSQSSADTIVAPLNYAQYSMRCRL